MNASEAQSSPKRSSPMLISAVVLHYAQSEAIEQTLRVIGPVGDGLVLRRERRSQWTMVLHDASEEGKWRLQYFTRDGFARHVAYEDATQAVRNAIAQGYTVRDDTALDRLFQTRRFQSSLRPR